MGNKNVSNNPISKQPLAGIVLAGGLSSRMGRDKATLPWGDSDLLHNVLDRLAPVCSELIVVSNVPRKITREGVRVVADHYPQCGPLAGMHAGLLAAEAEYSFITACDMPFLNTSAVAFIAAVAAGYHAAIPFIDGYYNPLHAIYHRHCLVWIKAMLAAGDYCILNFYPAISLRQVSGAELRQFDPELKTFCNINTPADLTIEKIESAAASCCFLEKK